MTQVAVKPGRLQFIGADNQLPAEYGREFTEIDFSYENPTVALLRIQASTGEDVE